MADWYVVNARDTPWFHAEGRPALTALGDDGERLKQFGINLNVLWPGQAMGRYHAEKDQEAFLVLRGEALLLVEGEERPLREWDFFHCPAGTAHIILGAGDGPAVVLAVGGRQFAEDPEGLSYPVDEVALKHGAGVTEFTHSPKVAYADVSPARTPGPYKEGWLS
jgi:uncharacterized cupin superfamily protein